MILNYIWWRDSSSGDLRNVKYTFIAITPKSTRTQSSSIFWGPIYVYQIDVFKNYLYSIRIVCKKKKKERNDYTKM